MLLTVAISSRALFDLEESHELFEREGLESYRKFQIAHENEPLKPGVAFDLVSKLLALNDKQERRVEVILLSRNSGDTGLRIFNSIEHYGLDIIRAAFTSGNSPNPYIPAFEADLFLSTHRDDVTCTLEAGFPAALILNRQNRDTARQPELRIAFDGDAVLFSDEAEAIYQNQGLEAFSEYEKKEAAKPLPDGPFKRVLSAIHAIQASYPAEQSPIRTALVTARSAPAHKRVILTLRAWGIRIDEALFLGGRDKGAFLKSFGADIFFDDQHQHCASAVEHVATGHVPHGIVNKA